MILFRSLFSKYTAIVAGMAFFATGCSTDLDPNADYRETMVIYSVLNPTETVHYVKVTKAYLNTNSNAFDIAAGSPDSSYYAPEVLKVELQKLSVTNADTSVLGTTELIRIDTTGKQPGTFFSGKQVLFRTKPGLPGLPVVPGKPGQLDQNGIYRIVATNKNTGNVASGATEMVKDNANSSNSFCINRIPAISGFTGNCYAESDSAAYEPQEKGLQIRFRPAQKALIYTAKTTFYFEETTNGVKELKTVEWYEANNFMVDPNTSPVAIEVIQNAFYDNVVKLINTANDNATTTRKAKFVKISVTAGSDALSKNFLANNAYSVFSQTRPHYDNVKNGAGLVASRLTKRTNGVFYKSPKSREAENKLITGYPNLKFNL